MEDNSSGRSFVPANLKPQDDSEKLANSTTRAMRKLAMRRLAKQLWWASEEIMGSNNDINQFSRHYNHFSDCTVTNKTLCLFIRQSCRLAAGPVGISVDLQLAA